MAVEAAQAKPLLLLAQGSCGVAESSRVGELNDPLPVESSIELYVHIVLLVVCAVAFPLGGRRPIPPEGEQMLCPTLALITLEGVEAPPSHATGN